MKKYIEHLVDSIEGYGNIIVTKPNGETKKYPFKNTITDHFRKNMMHAILYGDTENAQLDVGNKYHYSNKMYAYRFRVTVGKEGGGTVNNNSSSVADGSYNNDIEALTGLRRFLSFLPSNNSEKSKTRKTEDSKKRLSLSLDTLIPENPNLPYDMKELITSLSDQFDFFELQENFAKNILIGFIRLDGETVGVVANQPMVLAGCLDIDSSRKAARFVRFCDAFNIPILTLVDVPGFMPGTTQEYGGIIKHGAKLLFAYAEATTPKVTLITRKAYGGAYDVMSSKHLRGDANYAWPTAEIAVMGAKGAVEILFRDELDDPTKIQKRTLDYEETFANPFIAAERGFLDDVIIPSNSRYRLIQAFSKLKNKTQTNPDKKFGNIPL